MDPLTLIIILSLLNVNINITTLDLFNLVSFSIYGSLSLTTL
jgi:hypothetical protein